MQNSTMNMYPHKFLVTMTITEFIEKYGMMNFGQGECLEDGEVSVAGRITSKRTCSSKLLFYILRGGEAEVQVVTNARISELEEAEFSNLHSCVKWFDIVGVTGFPGKTKRGELSIFAKSFIVLSPCLHAIPIQSLKRRGEVWLPGNIRNPDLYILNDVETRYNQRYLDLMLNDEVRLVFKTRSKVIKYIREFLDDMGFLEVETPIMNDKLPPSGAAASFITYHNDLNMKLYLRNTPDLYLKQLLVGELDRVYEIGKQFKNEAVDELHNPEHTTCNSYMSYSDYNDTMELTEKLLSGMVKKLTGSFVIKCHSEKALVDIDFTPPFRRINVIEELEKVTNLCIPKDLASEEANRCLRDACAKYNVRCTHPQTTARLLDELVAHFLYQTSVNPTFFMDHPNMISPLTAKCHRSENGLTEYSELLVNKHRLCYTCSELNDPVLQASDDTTLDYGLPPCASWALDIDNLSMLLTDSQSIQEVLLFPLMKSLVEPHRHDSPLCYSRVRIVVVGDIHEDWVLEQDLKALHFLQPDMVMFTGDFGNENVDLVKSISNLNFPKVAILGNHDSWSTSKFSNKVKDGVQLQLEYLGDAHVGYHHLDFPQFKLSVVGGRPFSCGGDQLFRNKLLKARYGVRNMEESAERIYKAASRTPKENSIILLAHNGPKGLGSGNDDICGIDWDSKGGDFGDPDLTQAIKQIKETTSYRIPLVVFGHMHKELSGGGSRKMIAFDADNTMYLNAAIVPRVKSLNSGGSIRAFTMVEFSDGKITKVAESWVSIIDDKASLQEENLLFINNIEVEKCTPST